MRINQTFTQTQNSTQKSQQPKIPLLYRIILLFCSMYSLPALALTLTFSSPSVSENSGTLSTTVSRTNTTSDVTVTLSSSDISEVFPPSTITIPAGQASETFDVFIVDDTFVDGTQTVTITATATGFTTASSTLDVTDDEAAPASAESIPIFSPFGLFALLLGLFWFGRRSIIKS